MKKLPIFLVFLLMVLSCYQSIDKEFDKLDKKIVTDPYGAYKELSGIESGKLHSASRRARYALLMSLAMDKTYVDVADDSLIQIAVQYYTRHRNHQAKMLSLYSLARVQRNARNNAGAIISLLQAKELAEQLSDNHYYGLITRNMAELYGACNDDDSELKYYKESYGAFFSANEIRYGAYSQLGEARVYVAKGMKATADSLFRIIEQHARTVHDDYLLSSILLDRSLNLIKADKANADTVITLYSIIDSLNTNKKETVDYGVLARAFNELKQPDSVSHYLSLAQQSAKTSLDSAHLYNTLAVILSENGDYKSAQEYVMQGVKIHNRIVNSRENQLLANAISAYNQHEALRQSTNARLRLIILIVSLLLFFIVLGVLITIIQLRKKQIREKSRVIRQKEFEIEENMAQIQLISEELQDVRDNQSDMARTINELISSKIALVKICADSYEAVNNEPKENSRDPYRYLDEDPLSKKLTEMRHFLQALDGFRKDDSLFALLEDSVNKWRDNIMFKLRKACSKDLMEKPQFNETDFRILMLLYAGIPDRTIAFLLDMSCAAIRTRKTRYKERLGKQDIQDGAYFVQEMVSGPTKLSRVIIEKV